MDTVGEDTEQTAKRVRRQTLPPACLIIHALAYVQHIPWRRKKFTASLQPAKAYEHGSVMMSGPVWQWPTQEHKQTSLPLGLGQQ